MNSRNTHLSENLQFFAYPLGSDQLRAPVKPFPWPWGFLTHAIIIYVQPQSQNKAHRKGKRQHEQVFEILTHIKIKYMHTYIFYIKSQCKTVIKEHVPGAQMTQFCTWQNNCLPPSLQTSSYQHSPEHSWANSFCNFIFSLFIWPGEIIFSSWSKHSEQIKIHKYI